MKKKNICISLMVVIIYLIIFKGVGIFLSTVFRDTILRNLDLWNVFLYTFMAILLLIYLTITKKTDVFDLDGKKVGKGLSYGLGMLIPAVLFAIMSMSDNDSTVSLSVVGSILVFLKYLVAAFDEEVLTRGILLKSFKDYFGKSKRGVILACLWAGLAFGLMHLTNLLAGHSFWQVMAQVLTTVGMGFYLGALYIRSGNIWTTTIVHFIWNLGLSFNNLFYVAEESTSNPGPASLIFGIVMGGYLFFMGLLNINKMYKKTN